MASTSKQMTQRFGRTTATTTTVLNDNGCQMIPANGPFGNKTIGPRTVIVPADPIEWNEGTTYEYLTLVLAPSGNSYISKRDVPAGTPVTNTEYWIKSSDWNAQLAAIQDNIDSIGSSIDNFKRVIYPTMFGAKGDGTTDDSAAIASCFAALATDEYGYMDLQGLIYNIESPMNIPNLTNKIIKNGTFLACSNMSVLINMNANSSDSSFPYNRVTFQDVIFDGGFNVTDSLVYINKAIALKFMNCSFIHFGSTGIHSANTESHEIVVDTCYFRAYDWDQTPPSQITNSIGMQFDNPDNFIVNNIVICNTGIYLNGSYQTISDCHIYRPDNTEVTGDTAGTSIYFSAGAFRSRIENCYLDGQPVVVKNAWHIGFTDCLFLIATPDKTAVVLDIDSSHYVVDQFNFINCIACYAGTDNIDFFTVKNVEYYQGLRNIVMITPDVNNININKEIICENNYSDVSSLLNAMPLHFFNIDGGLIYNALSVYHTNLAFALSFGTKLSINSDRNAVMTWGSHNPGVNEDNCSGNIIKGSNTPDDKGWTCYTIELEPNTPYIMKCDSADDISGPNMANVNVFGLSELSQSASITKVNDASNRFTTDSSPYYAVGIWDSNNNKTLGVNIYKEI